MGTRTPIKETERRAEVFEDRHGEGATELDALEALHTGKLRQIVEREIERYFDTNLADAVNETASEIEWSIADITRKVHAEHEVKIKTLESEWKKIAKEHARQIAAWQKQAKVVWRAITEDLEAKAPDPDEIDWPQPADGDEDDDPLFDSTRDYVEQMDRYKAFQDKPTERRRRNGGGGS